MSNTENFYIYVGHSDPPHSVWKLIPDTPEAHQKAIEEGYTAGSTMSFAYEPENGKPEPVRRGSLFLDFDSKDYPAVAVDMAREFIVRLTERFGVDPGELRYWMSGGKGCHIEIPAAIYSGEAGHPELPLIQKNMLTLLGILEFHNPKVCDILDFQLYCKGRGKLLRWSNIKRLNGCYKVEVNAWEFLNLDYPALERLTLEPRTGFDPGTKEPSKSKELTRIYDLAVSWRRQYTNGVNPVSGIEALFNCAFISHCYENQATLQEPYWWVMISIFSTFGDLGREAIHLFSRDYPGYTFDETEKKISGQRHSKGPITCDYIKGQGFDCGKHCGVRSPADLWKYRRSEETRRLSNFIHKADGLYRQNETGDGEPAKVCSPLKVLGKMRNPEGIGWSRLVEISTPDGRKKEVCVYMRDMKGRGEGLIGLLLDHGLELGQTSPKSQQYLMEYLMNGAPQDLPLLCVQRIGWLENIYILPDEVFGDHLKETVHFQAEGMDNLHQTAGTLEEWQEHIGGYCRGNSLLKLLVSYALTGPLLKQVGLEGGGLHIYGGSSTGKTTCALVAGSVCGGGGRRGFIRQWRATHNALESVATQHSDNLLILDEISQASGETISQVSYMLANGQGKDRLRSDASRRRTYQWHLNFLSTGELTINDKIQEFGKHTTLVGQEVRVVDLPIDGMETGNVFQELHGLLDGSKLSELLSFNATKYYGTPMRAFLTKLCESLDDNRILVETDMEAFSAENCPMDASGQVKRVARKFGLIAAVGELAITFKVLPFESGESKKAASEWFKIWLNSREGHGNLEIIKIIQRLQDHLSVNSSRYVDRDSSTSCIPYKHEGYTWKENDKRHYMMLKAVFNSLTRGVNRKALFTELERLGYLAYNSEGNLKDSISVSGDSKRGWVFIPSAWEGEPTLEEGEEELKRANQLIDNLFE